jgi:hypothetical protein
MEEVKLPAFCVLAESILRTLHKQINGPKPSCARLDGHEVLGPEKLEDIRTRFLLWTGNLGVMHKAEDPRALDRRLLDAPEAASRLRGILVEMEDLLHQCEPYPAPKIGIQTK